MLAGQPHRAKLNEAADTSQLNGKEQRAPHRRSKKGDGSVKLNGGVKRKKLQKNNVGLMGTTLLTRSKKREMRRQTPAYGGRENFNGNVVGGLRALCNKRWSQA